MTTTGAGTGTQAAAPGATTAQNLIDQAQVALADTAAAEFSEAQLLQFLNEAIREYSQQLPRLSTTSLTASGRTYTLPYDLKAVISVEYPAGEEPPCFLAQVPHKALRFTDRPAYDVLHRLDLTSYPQLLLSFDPTAGETIAVRYQHPHNHSLAAADHVTVPADHHHVLISYMLYAASRMQQLIEQANPTGSSSLLMAQLMTNTRRAELTYLNALNRILQATAGQSSSASWRMDDFDRVY